MVVDIALGVAMTVFTKPQIFSNTQTRLVFLGPCSAAELELC